MKVPLIVSGNIFTLDDAINALNITKADAVMVARGGVGNPFLITQIKHYYETGEKLPNPSLEEQKEYCLDLARYLIEEKGEDKGMRIFRSMAPRFFTGYPNSKELRSKLVQTLTTYQDLIKILDELISAYEIMAELYEEKKNSLVKNHYDELGVLDNRIVENYEHLKFLNKQNPLLIQGVFYFI
jgi:tRNA-dihydrouridine synthase